MIENGDERQDIYEVIETKKKEKSVPRKFPQLVAGIRIQYKDLNEATSRKNKKEKRKLPDNRSRKGA